MTQITTSFNVATGGGCACCGGGPTPCYLTMPTILIDSSSTNYPDLTTATNAISDQVAGCLAESYSTASTGATRTTFTATFIAGTLAITSQASYISFAGPSDRVAFHAFLTAADGISVVYNLSTTTGSGPSGYHVDLYADDQTTLLDTTGASSIPISGTFSPTISADGYYWIVATAFHALFPPAASVSSIVLSSTGGSSFLPCDVRAAYDDGSGGTAYVICI